MRYSIKVLHTNNHFWIDEEHGAFGELWQDFPGFYWSFVLDQIDKKLALCFNNTNLRCDNINVGYNKKYQFNFKIILTTKPCIKESSFE